MEDVTSSPPGGSTAPTARSAALVDALREVERIFVWIEGRVIDGPSVTMAKSGKEHVSKIIASLSPEGFDG